MLVHAFVLSLILRLVSAKGKPRKVKNQDCLLFRIRMTPRTTALPSSPPRCLLHYFSAQNARLKNEKTPSPQKTNSDQAC